MPDQEGYCEAVDLLGLVLPAVPLVLAASKGPMVQAYVDVDSGLYSTAGMSE
jgi:hypothetical protein